MAGGALRSPRREVSNLPDIQARLRADCLLSGARYAIRRSRPLGGGHNRGCGVKDLSPASQDKVAAYLNSRCGALPDLLAGRFAGGGRMVRKVAQTAKRATQGKAAAPAPLTEAERARANGAIEVTVRRVAEGDR